MSRVATRDLGEEVGTMDKSPLPAKLMSLDIFDLDVHVNLPNAKKGRPGHLHYDLRFLFTLDGTIPAQCDESSNEARWFATQDYRRDLQAAAGLPEGCEDGSGSMRMRKKVMANANL